MMFFIFVLMNDVGYSIARRLCLCQHFLRILIVASRLNLEIRCKKYTVAKLGRFFALFR